jgi:hypothetical protein
MEFQTQALPRWYAQQTQGTLVYTWGNANLGTKLLGNICTCCELGKRLPNPSDCKKSWSVFEEYRFFPQANLEIPLFIELPIGFDTPNNKECRFYILKLNKSLYGLKQAEYNWFAKLSNGLQDRGIVQSSINSCVFFGPGCIVLTYVDDCIIVGDSMDCINTLIQSLYEGDENFVLQDEGSIDKYLGVDIKQMNSSKFELTQPFLIERVTKLLGTDNRKPNEILTPVGKPLLNKDLDGVPQKYDWEYQSAIGMLTYLTGSVRPDIAMAVHQCARFSVKPMHLHKQAVMRIGRYLLSTFKKGMIYKPDLMKGIEIYVDAGFVGGWDPADAMNADNIYSRTGYVIQYAGCPIYCAVEEGNQCYIYALSSPAKICDRSEGDNQSCIAMAQNSKFSA